MDKKQSQWIHAKRRAKQRYGIALNRKDRIAIVQKIMRGKAEFLKRTSNRASVFAVSYKSIDFVLVYDKIRKSIATFLPKRTL